MDGARIRRYADILYEAERGRKAVPPLREQEPLLTVDEAYAIQMANVERVVREGHAISGKKIGLTSPGIRKQLGVDEPDYGHLFEAMDCRDGNVSTGRLIQPKIEAEIAFVLKKDLSGGNVTVDDVREATDHVVASFEIVDSRIADWKIGLVDTVADNASSGRYVLGGKKLSLHEVNPAEVGMKLYRNGTLVAEGQGGAVMGDPCLSVAWLANRLWDYGVVLKKGEVILSGAFTAAPVATKGDVFEAVFSSLGSVKAEFV